MSVSVRVSVRAGVGVGLGVRVRMRVSASPDLPVGTVAAATHGPGDEGSSRRRWPKDDGGKSSTVFECPVANMNQRVR